MGERRASSARCSHQPSSCHHLAGRRVPPSPHAGRIERRLLQPVLGRASAACGGERPPDSVEFILVPAHGVLDGRRGVPVVVQLAAKEVAAEDALHGGGGRRPLELGKGVDWRWALPPAAFISCIVVCRTGDAGWEMEPVEEGDIGVRWRAE